MDENNIIENIKINLHDLGYDYALLTKSQHKQLLRIDAEIAKRILNQKNALSSIKNNKISITSIASAIGITRKTIYDNEILKNYIEHSKLSDDNLTSQSDDLILLKNHLSEARDIIKKMVHRDNQIEQLNSEIQTLQKELMHKNEYIERQIKTNIELQNKLNDYDRKARLKKDLKLIK